MRLNNLLAACLLTLWLLAIAAPLTSPAYQSGGDQFFVVVSMTRNGPDTYDVKLKNPRTGYVHSVTVFIDIIVNLAVGDWVSERREGGRVVLIPRGGRAPNPRPDPPPRPQPPPPDPRPEPRPRPRTDPWGFPPAYADDLPVKHTDKNTWRPKGDAARRPPIQFPTLDPSNYNVYPIDTVEVINADKHVKNPDKPLAGRQAIAGVCDVVANGSFTFQNAGGTEMFAAAPVMRDGKLDNAGLPKTWNRGGMAVLRDGSIVLGQQPGPPGNISPARRDSEVERVIKEEFGEYQNPVKDFMGGGALLIKDGVAVSSQDLYERQRFDNGGQGLRAEQFRTTNHTLVGVCAGQAFLIIAKGQSGLEMQQKLLRAGFGSVLMFDGGAGFYWRDTSGNRGDGSNLLGLCVKTRRRAGVR
ncbi:MAG TPA: hypothetical protein VNI02_03725 [Blastocatellia bacterium]|jgi:hypothetical protein|nr:hypothetical protein [Blastocatellia bacterium]